MKLVFATHNQNKLKEIQKLLPPFINLVSLTDLGCLEPIPETADTLKGNAKLKADYVYKTYQLPCFADDTGLLVDALNGAPGVYSARYAGEENDANANMDKLLTNLKDKADRSASFKTVIALNLDNHTLFFKGSVKGEITKVKNGKNGFGYDPIFKPEGFDKTFAELPLKVKNQIGHRGKAFSKLISYLNTQHVRP
ncbi:non-canonical purine NTP diphosphatase [Maribacter sp. MMG018]|uniref:non-canonical purine NTP diphosphatase n=1 Tax=Maribacter sp. MMG018 TaxID=2822688 RepID=UPI001B3646AF|nr:non-canonical purine NTP diphosphatase [Maribacter sp. MMG018]MBQ4914857.1 non-canonical purine NTP diphosphatase [Maribacter sp. MMG018]